MMSLSLRVPETIGQTEGISVAVPVYDSTSTFAAIAERLVLVLEHAP